MKKTTIANMVLKVGIPAGIIAILLSGCNSGSSTSSATPGVVYKQFNYSSLPGSSNLITGVRGVIGSSNVYITGIYDESSGALGQGLLYTGSITGGGSWQVLNYPGADVTSTSLYGPDNDGFGNIVIAGSYTTVASGDKDLGLLYQGPIDGSGTWSTLDMSSLIVNPGESAIFTFAHSTIGGLVVGNFDTNLETGRAFIYNINTNSYIEFKKPGAVSTTLYGIWYNGGTSYTVAGGYSNVDESGISIAYLADWDSATNMASNWESYTYNNQSSVNIVTHFEGITTDSSGGYNLAADFADSDGSNSGASFANVARNADGTFNSNATWIAVKYPNSEITSANTVYQNYILGVYSLASESEIVNAFSAAVPFVN